MRNLLLFAAFMLVNCSLLAQEAKTNILIDGKNLEISIKKVTDGYKYSFKQEGNAEILPEYNSTLLNRETFSALTKSAFKEINKDMNNEEALAIQESVDMTFIELVAILFNEDAEGPKIATLKLKEKIPVYTDITTGPQIYSLIPSDCYVVFKDGFIEQIKVYGKVEIDLINAKIATVNKETAAQEKVEKAKNELDKAKIKVNNAKTNLKKAQKIDQDKVESVRQEFENARRKVKKDQTKVEKAEAELKDAQRECFLVEELIKMDSRYHVNKIKVEESEKIIKTSKTSVKEAEEKLIVAETKYALAKKVADSVKLIAAEAVLSENEKPDAKLLSDMKKQITDAENEFKKTETVLEKAKAELTLKKNTLEQAKDDLTIAEKELSKSETSLLEAKIRLEAQLQQGKGNFIIRDGEEYGFTNIYSIGISSLTNRKNLSNISIYIDNSKKPDAARINLEEAINYNSIPEDGTRDYSPANGKVELMKGQTIDLRKPTNEKLFEFKVFTDAVGFGEDTPNGLVQLELEKRVPINTNMGQFLYYYRGGWSLFSYIDFEFTYSKIENKVKYLELDANTYSYTPANDTVSRDTTAYYLDALQVYRHQIFQVGAKLNLLLIESQPYKFDFEINLHANFGYARVIDTIVSDNETINIDAPLNSFMLAPEVKFIFYPEKRLNFSISDKVTRQYFLYNTDKFDYSSTVENELVQGSKWFNTVSINAYYWPSDQGKIFVRYSFNHELNNVNSNFSQFQIGYSMYLKTSKKD